MAIDQTDMTEVRTLHVEHPNEAMSLIGKTFVTPWFQMDAVRGNEFEHSTYINEYAHPYGGEVGYGDDLVEGFHLLGMLDYLCNQSLYAGGPWIAWNYGLDHARFVTVIRHADWFRLNGTVRAVEEREGQGHLLTLELVGEVKDRDRPGFVATLKALWTTAS